MARSTARHVFFCSCCPLALSLLLFPFIPNCLQPEAFHPCTKYAIASADTGFADRMLRKIGKGLSNGLRNSSIDGLDESLSNYYYTISSPPFFSFPFAPLPRPLPLAPLPPAAIALASAPPPRLRSHRIWQCEL